jgi:hypothetical protein
MENGLAWGVENLDGFSCRADGRSRRRAALIALDQADAREVRLPDAERISAAVVKTFRVLAVACAEGGRLTRADGQNPAIRARRFSTYGLVKASRSPR